MLYAQHKIAFHCQFMTKTEDSLIFFKFLHLKMLLLHLGFCPEVGNILNGKVSHVTPQVGKAAIEFRCANNSFQLIGKTRLECIDGQWNGKLPYCQSKSSKRS